MLNWVVGNCVRTGLLSGAAVIGGLFTICGSASAGPWAEMGDAALRSDIELLASVGVIDTITTQWPLPWKGLSDRLRTSSLSDQPDYIREAAARLRARAASDTAPGLRASVFVDGTSSPATIRGYDALGRQGLLAGASIEYVGADTVVHLNVGARSTTKFDRQVLDFDGSYIAQRLGGAIVYAGYMPHWWGPGWMSALSLSTNARPVPQIGITRVSTAPFESPWLSWIGPWQFEFFVGVLDGPRVARNTIYDGTRISISPLPGLEIAASRTDMMCGTGHTCKPLVAYFNPTNDSNRINDVNDQATIELRYTGAFYAWNYAVYGQVMNEDTNFATDSSSSHLAGGSLWHPIFGGIGRLTFEYADTTPSWNMFGGAAHHGFAYTSGQYADGMHYRGQTLGASIDTDSRLVSLAGSFTDASGRIFSLTYHRVKLSDPLNPSGNVVTSVPVKYNLVQGRISMPLSWKENTVRIDLEGRVQDDQPRPRRGKLAAIELAMRFGL